MLCKETGVLPGSDFYFYTPSVMARKQLFYFTSVGHFFCDHGYEIERTVDYGNYMLFLVTKGQMLITVEGDSAVVKEGGMAFLNCHVPHRYSAACYTEFLWIHFNGSNLGQFYKDIMERLDGGHSFYLDDTEKIERQFRKIISDCRYERFCSEFDDSLCIYELLITLYKSMLGIKEWEDVAGEATIDEALHFIGDHLGSELSVSMVARHVGLSESHFTRKFRKAMNSSPKEYIIRRRLNEAKRLLKTTTSTVSEIAFTVGFNSESHFINTFTAQTGISPKKFRQFPL